LSNKDAFGAPYFVLEFILKRTKYFALLFSIILFLNLFSFIYVEKPLNAEASYFIRR